MTHEQLKVAHEVALNEIMRLREELEGEREHRRGETDMRIRYYQQLGIIEDHIKTASVIRPTHTPDDEPAKVLVWQEDWDVIVAASKGYR